MKYEVVRRRSVRLLAAAASVCLMLPLGSYAQRGQRGAQTPQTAKTNAATDITGTWVSVITEDWKYRMVTPRKGDFDGVPGTVEAFRAANAWDPAKAMAPSASCDNRDACVFPGRMTTH